MEQKKALIVYGSPRINGNTGYLVKTFVQNFDGETDFVYAFPQLSADKKGISPCIGCEACSKRDCVIQDDFHKITDGDYDILVIASPIYMSNLTPPMFNVITRFNFLFHQPKQQEVKSEKAGVLILTGGGSACKKLQGETNEDLPIRQAKYIFGKTNTKLPAQNMVLSLKTDSVPAKEDVSAIEKIKQIAKNLSRNNVETRTK